MNKDDRRKALKAELKVLEGINAEREDTGRANLGLFLGGLFFGFLLGSAYMIIYYA